MSLDERKQRWEKMMDHLLKYDINRWCDDFLNDLTAEDDDDAAAMI
jgi:trehalose 6-phosphate synthase